MKSFFKNNSRTIVIIGVVVALFYVLSWFNRDQTEDFFHKPEAGQIYILNNADSYAVMRLNQVTDQHYFFSNYDFIFKDAIPKREQILENEFDLNFNVIYERAEINRLYQTKRIVRIYES